MVDIVQDIGRNSGRQVRAGVGRLGGGGGPLGGGGGVLGGGVLGGGGPHGTNDDFWLPKVRHFAAQLYNVLSGVWSNWPGQKRGTTAVPQCGEERGLTQGGWAGLCLGEWVGGHVGGVGMWAFTSKSELMMTCPQIEGVSSQLDAREGSRRNLPHV